MRYWKRLTQRETLADADANVLGIVRVRGAAAQANAQMVVIDDQKRLRVNRVDCRHIRERELESRTQAKGIGGGTEKHCLAKLFPLAHVQQSNQRLPANRAESHHH